MIVYKMFKSQTVTTCIFRAQCHPSNCITVFISFLSFSTHFSNIKRFCVGTRPFRCSCPFLENRLKGQESKVKRMKSPFKLEEKKWIIEFDERQHCGFQSQEKRLSKPPPLNRSLSLLVAAGALQLSDFERLRKRGN